MCIGHLREARFLSPGRRGHWRLTLAFCSPLNCNKVGSITAFSPGFSWRTAEERVLIAGNAAVQGFNLRSERMCTRSDQTSRIVTLTPPGWRMRFGLREGSATAARRQSFTLPPCHWFPLLTLGHSLEIELEIVENRAPLFLVLVAFVSLHLLPFQTAERLIGIAYTVRTPLNG